jgi:hypothetical protein
LSPSELTQKTVHVGFDPRHLCQTDLVNLVGRQIGRGIATEVVSVRRAGICWSRAM